MLVVAFVPLGPALGIVVYGRIPWTELILASAVVGWLGWKCRRSEDSADPVLAAAALAWTTVVVTSALALWWASVWASVPPPMSASEWANRLWRDLVLYAPLRQALRLAWGAAAVVWIAETAREGHRRLQLARLLVVSVAAVALVSLYRVAEIAVRTEAPMDRALEVIHTLRIAPLVGDVNSLGALLLLVSPMAFQLALTRGQRLLGLAALAMLLSASWLAGSRSALGVIPLALAATAALRSEWGRRWQAWAAAAGVGLAALGLFLLAPTGRHVEPSLAWIVRRDMGIVAVRMLNDAPVFGAGLGQFYARSTAYMPDTVRKHYPRENAHNQFLQVAGELGMLGLVAFVGLLAAAAWPALRWRPPEAAGAISGVFGFLLSSLAQHPLLDPTVAATFWLALGLLAAYGTGVGRSPGRPWRVVAAGVAAVAVITLPIQAIGRARAIDLTGTTTGTRTIRDDNGTRFFRSADTATLYVSVQARQCTVTFRLGDHSGEAALTLRLDHRDAGTVNATGESWRSVVLRLPERATKLTHRRLDVTWAGRRPGRAMVEVGPAECR